MKASMGFADAGGGSARTTGFSDHNEGSAFAGLGAWGATAGRLAPLGAAPHIAMDDKVQTATRSRKNTVNGKTSADRDTSSA